MRLTRVPCQFIKRLNGETLNWTRGQVCIEAGSLSSQMCEVIASLPLQSSYTN